MKYSGFHRVLGILHHEERSTWSICFGNQIVVDELDTLRRSYKQEGRTPPSYTALVIKAIAGGVRELLPRYPELNSMLTGVPPFRRIHVFDRICAGCAVARTEDGLDRTGHHVIEDADRKTLEQITEELRVASTQPVDNVPSLRSAFSLYRRPYPVQRLMMLFGWRVPALRRQYRGTFSVTTVGKFGVDYQLTLPQTSCLEFGFGVICERPVARDGQLTVARTFNLTVSFDRRLMNGRPCALLMERLRDILEHAEFADTGQSPTAGDAPLNISAAG